MTSEANNLSLTSEDWQTGNEYRRSNYIRNITGWPVPYHWDNNRRVRDPWRLFSEFQPRSFELPSTPSQPLSPLGIVILDEDAINQRLQQIFNISMAGARRQQWQPGPSSPQREEPGLNSHEFKKAMSKMRTQIFCPIYPRQKAYKKGLFSRHSTSHHIQEEDEDNDEGRECAICLEAFVPNEKLLVTPCNHMFHKDCLVPWVKGHDKCPVCRSVFCERSSETNSRPHIVNNNNTNRNTFNRNLGIQRSLFHF